MARSGEGDFAIQVDPNLTPEVVEELKDSPVILNLAEEAVKAMESRRGENIKEWASRLADDVAKLND